jgi:hypothetical protein
MGRWGILTRPQVGDFGWPPGLGNAIPCIMEATLHVHNTQGMKPSSHHAFGKNGVSVRFVCIVLIKARLLGNSTRK